VEVICFLLGLYALAVLAWVILSWIQVSGSHPLSRVTYFLDRIIHPVILPLRRVIPPVRLGGGALDLSPIVLLVGLSLLRNIIC